jgi:hypothetical protein
MKKLIVLVSLILLTACVALERETKRDFMDHTFYASNPNMAVKIANNFQPVDQNKDNGFAMYSNSMSGSNIETERFRFSDNTKKTAFVILISKAREGFWQSNLNEGFRNHLEAGKIEEGGRQYYYAIFADKGHDNKYYLVKRYARRSGATSQTLLQYYYVRAIDAKLDDFSRWRDPNRLRQDQRDVLTQFKKDSERDIQFIEYKTPEKKS